MDELKEIAQRTERAIRAFVEYRKARTEINFMQLDMAMLDLYDVVGLMLSEDEQYKLAIDLVEKIDPEFAKEIEERIDAIATDPEEEIPDPSKVN